MQFAAATEGEGKGKSRVAVFAMELVKKRRLSLSLFLSLFLSLSISSYLSLSMLDCQKVSGARVDGKTNKHDNTLGERERERKGKKDVAIDCVEALLMCFRA
jgi:hypothetical protein